MSESDGPQLATQVDLGQGSNPPPSQGTVLRAATQAKAITELTALEAQKKAQEELNEKEAIRIVLKKTEYKKTDGLEEGDDKKSDAQLKDIVERIMADELADTMTILRENHRIKLEKRHNLRAAKGMKTLDIAGKSKSTLYPVVTFEVQARRMIMNGAVNAKVITPKEKRRYGHLMSVKRNYIDKYPEQQLGSARSVRRHIRIILRNANNIEKVSKDVVMQFIEYNNGKNTHSKLEEWILASAAIAVVEKNKTLLGRHAIVTAQYLKLHKRNEGI
jgi:hypothetical protein